MRCVDMALRSPLGSSPSILRIWARTRQLIRGAGIGGILAGTAVSGCIHQQSPVIAAPTPTAPSIADAAHPVPPIAPDYLPDSLFAALGIVRGQSDTAMFMVRSIVKVAFKDGTVQRERQQAVDAVKGVVVGGARVADDGEYFVRISGSTAGDIQAAVRKLQALSQVDLAVPMFVGPRGALRP